MPRIVIINASLGGSRGNTARLLRRARSRLELSGCEVDEIVLAEHEDSVIDSLRRADGILIATGTYWDSWSSLLQCFFEAATRWEGSSMWLGKPVAAIVTEHSVGGKAVLSRLQGVMTTLGCSVPPMSGMVYSLANHLALKSGTGAACLDELWCPNDVDVVCHNLVAAATGQKDWRTWTVGCGDAGAAWFDD